MDSIRLENLRSFVDTDHIQLTKLNIFVGKNNSGKSSLLRIFPLLKQTAQVRTVSDLLWFGPYVDFGSHAEAQSTLTANDEIAITIGFSLEFLGNPYRSGGHVYSQPIESTQNANLETSISIRQKPNPENKSFLSKYIIEIAEQEIILQISDDLNVEEYLVNDEPFTSFARSSLDLVRSFGILPRAARRFQEGRSNVERDLVHLLRPLVQSEIPDEEIYKACDSIGFGPPDRMLRQVMSLELGTDYRRHVTDNWKINDKTFREFVTRVYARSLPEILDQIDNYLTELVTSIQYVSPLRATAERYYRIQGLAVDEIDPQGRNLAMFLNNLSEGDATAFATWTYENMQFDVRTDLSKGHVSVVIAENESSVRTNLADSGFGYSQVLPILAQLWKGETDMSGITVPLIFAIEQPELHMHPKMQAQLADLLLRLVANPAPGARDLQVILETHSDTIVSQMGKAVASKLIKSKDVAVYLFEKSGTANPTEIRKAEFDSDGFLTDWPYGFFDAKA